MSQLLSKNRRRLLIVSDTAMFEKDHQKLALGPVVREIESISSLFDSITWIGFNRPELRETPSFSPIKDKGIRLIFLRKCGGIRLRDKIEVLLFMPMMTLRILREIMRHEVIYTRAPSTPAFIATLLSFIIFKKTFWHKYAGNWIQNPAPRFFAFQRSILKLARFSKVTINGQWPNQQKHCLSFENPCIEELEILKGRDILNEKTYTDPLHFCFVGRLEEAKGVQWILEAFKSLDSNSRIGSLHFVGDGPLRQQCEELAAISKIHVHVHGFLEHTQVASIMAEAHILILPSVAEGFPKVVAEAANFGCLPIVTDVSCIGQYIKHGENGFLLQPDQIQKGQLIDIIAQLPDAPKLKQMAKRAHALCTKYTYSHFVNRVKNEIL